MSFSPSSPFRSVSWAWERAQEIENGGSPFHKKIDGPWVHRAAKFLKKLRQAKSAWERRILEVETGMEDIFCAHSFWERPENPMSWALEARILARESDEDIAPKFGCKPGAIAAYENIFFNVRDRLDQRDYILNQAVGPKVMTGLDLRDTKLIFKFFGYLGGPLVLDEVMGNAAPVVHPTNRAAAADFFDTDQENVLRVKSDLAIRTAKYNFMSQYEVTATYHKLIEMKKADGGGTAGHQSIANNLGALFNACGQTFKVLDKNDQKLLPKAGVGMSLEERREWLKDQKTPDTVQQDVASLPEALSRFRDGQTQ